jgi:hypothetical protein
MLKDAEVSAKAIYTLMADPKKENISGHFYHLTIEEVPAKHATDRTLSPLVFERTCQLTGIDPLTLERATPTSEINP